MRDYRGYLRAPYTDEELKRIMCRTESGKRCYQKMIEKRNNPIEKHNMKESKNQLLGASLINIMNKESELRNKKPNSTQTFAQVLDDISSLRGIKENSQNVSTAGEDVFMRSGIEYGASGICIPLEERSINSKNAPLGEFVSAFNRELNTQLIMRKLGCRVLPGLVGRSQIATYTGSTAHWEEETETAENSKGTFSKVTLTPHRLTAYLPVSKMELVQNRNISTFLANDLAQAIAEKIEETVFGNHVHDDNIPDGFFTDSNLDTITSPSYEDILEIESKVRNNGFPMKWALNSNIERLLKKTERKGSPIISGDLCSDRPFYSSDYLPKTEDTANLIYGRWNDFILGYWGAIEITYNPYSQAVNNIAEFIINFYLDWTWKKESFATAKLSTI